MAADERTEELREAARHRGLKLVKSRRRKPGGDFGRFGLTDPDGKPLFGFADEGLTASADDIAAYLRKGAAATWAESARTTPARPRTKPAPPSDAQPEREEAAEPARPARRAAAKERKSARRDKPASPPPPPPSPPPPPVPPAPTLKIRDARPADGKDIAALSGNDAKSVAAALRGGVSAIVADRGGVIGCVAFTVVPMLDGAIGRIVAIAVARDERRQGIGTALIDAACAALEARGYTEVEAMSAIALRNAHGFFRATAFRQSSYRFIRG